MTVAATENRYSRVSRRMWRDEKFRALSAPKPNARDLWLFLLTGPHCTAIPGLFVLGEASMAEELGWPLAATRAAFDEIVRAGMLRVDRGARLVWLPNALTHNPPASPNVVVSWRGPWSELPECALRIEARDALRAGLSEMGPSFADSFAIALGEAKARPSPNPSGGPRPKALVEPLAKPSPSQDQDQDQEQEQEDSRPVASAFHAPATGVEAAPGLSDSDAAELAALRAERDARIEAERVASEEAARLEAEKDAERRRRNREKAKAREENPPPFSIGAAFEFIASTANGRFIPGVERDWGGGVRIAVAKLIRTYPTREEWECLGRWLAAGGDNFRKVIGPSWAASTACADAMARAREWQAKGGGPVADPMQSGSFSVPRFNREAPPAAIPPPPVVKRGDLAVDQPAMERGTPEAKALAARLMAEFRAGKAAS